MQIVVLMVENGKPLLPTRIMHEVMSSHEDVLHAVQQVRLTTVLKAILTK